MPTKRSLQNYTYPEEEVKSVSELKKENKPLPSVYLKKKYDHFTLDAETNQLVYRERTLVPEHRVRQVIDEEYKKSFAGMNRLFQQILKKYIGVNQDAVEEYVKNQEVQQLHDQTTTPSLKETKERPIPNEPMSMVQIDLSFYDKRVLFVAIDILSKLLYATVIRNKEGKTVARELNKYLEAPGSSAIRTIGTDNGSEFQDEFAKVLKEKKIKHVLGRSYHPQSQAVVERVNRTMKNALEKYTTNGGKGWQRFLKTWVEEYNNTRHSATKLAPNDVKGERLAQRARKNIKDQSKRLTRERKELYEKNKGRLTFAVGDKVRLQKAKKSFLQKGYAQQYTKKIYEVEEIIYPKDGVPIYRLSGRKTNFSGDRLMKVDEEKLIAIPEQAPRQRAPAAPRAVAQAVAQRQRPARQKQVPAALADYVL